MRIPYKCEECGKDCELTRALACPDIEVHIAELRAYRSRARKLEALMRTYGTLRLSMFGADFFVGKFEAKEFGKGRTIEEALDSIGDLKP